jgi:sucrose phosphorylase
MNSLHRGIYEDLVFLYGETQARLIYDRLVQLLDRFRDQHPQLAKASTGGRVTESDSILITYGDMVSAEGEAPLHTLAGFLKRQVAGTISTFRLMFDAVINHISAESKWFKGFLKNDPRYRDYFTVVEPGTDLSQVFRPRTLPLLTPVQQDSVNSDRVERLVWTTFSPDQIDLNYRNPDLLLDIFESLLLYVDNGAEFIRLDAIAFIWKEIGTSCIHLPETHRIIQLMRKVLDLVAPGVAIISETNVPHRDNISYFGDGVNEAQMVYNFSLPPLTLNAFHSGSAETLSRWADSLKVPSEQVTFLNFLASHDGIGLTPARGILSDVDIEVMAQRVDELGGFVSSKTNPDGSTSPYELNVNFLDALADPAEKDESITLIAHRFLASQAVMLAMKGVPGIYFHSLFGSQGWQEGVNHTGRARTINRQKLANEQLERELAEPHSLRHLVFHGYSHMLNKRRTSPAFHPNGDQQIIFCHEAVFSLLRTSPDGRSFVICLHNVTSQSHQLSVKLDQLPVPRGYLWTDLITGRTVKVVNDLLKVTLEPFQILWLHRD